LDKLAIVFCTVPQDGSADALADSLVENKLAACVNVIPGIKSVFYWDGEVQREGEKLFIIKTLEENVDKVFKHIEVNHPYDVAERISIVPDKVGEDYLKWAVDFIEK
jgi:periplasmic divalent cation tolerance protein